MAQVNYKRGTLTAINNTAIQDGQLLFATDTGDLYIDVGNQRIKVAASGVTFDVVNSLPTTGANNTIYLLDNNGQYEQWVYDTTWVQINTLNLTNYYTKQEVDNLIHPITTTVSIATTDWVNSVAVKNVAGVTTTNTVICEISDPAVQCNGQLNGKLTFYAAILPTGTVTVKVVIL